MVVALLLMLMLMLMLMLLPMQPVTTKGSAKSAVRVAAEVGMAAGIMALLLLLLSNDCEEDDQQGVVIVMGQQGCSTRWRTAWTASRSEQTWGHGADPTAG